MSRLGLLHRIHRQTFDRLDGEPVEVRGQRGECVVESAGGLRFSHDPGANRDDWALATGPGAPQSERATPTIPAN